MIFCLWSYKRIKYIYLKSQSIDMFSFLQIYLLLSLVIGKVMSYGTFKLTNSATGLLYLVAINYTGLYANFIIIY